MKLSPLLYNKHKFLNHIVKHVICLNLSIPCTELKCILVHYTSYIKISHTAAVLPVQLLT